MPSTPLPSKEESQVQGGLGRAPNRPVIPQQDRAAWYIDSSRLASLNSQNNLGSKSYSLHGQGMEVSRKREHCQWQPKPSSPATALPPPTSRARPRCLPPSWATQATCRPCTWHAMGSRGDGTARPAAPREARPEGRLLGTLFLGWAPSVQRAAVTCRMGLRCQYEPGIVRPGTYNALGRLFIYKSTRAQCGLYTQLFPKMQIGFFL